MAHTFNSSAMYMQWATSAWGASCRRYQCQKAYNRCQVAASTSGRKAAVGPCPSGLCWKSCSFLAGNAAMRDASDRCFRAADIDLACAAKCSSSLARLRPWRRSLCSLQIGMLSQTWRGQQGGVSTSNTCTHVYRLQEVQYSMSWKGLPMVDKWRPRYIFLPACFIQCWKG